MPYLLLFEKLIILTVFPSLGYNTLRAQPSSCSLGPLVRTRFYSVPYRGSSYRTECFMPHHTGTPMASVAFNSHWDESSCMPVTKFPVPNIFTLAALSIWAQRKQTVMIFICCSWRSGPQEQREDCCLWSGYLVTSTALRARLARKWGWEQPNGFLPPLFALLFSPFAPTAESIVHVKCHLGLPLPLVTISCGTYV